MTSLYIGCMAVALCAQTPEYGYDVASIKPSGMGTNNSRIAPGPQGGMRAQNVTTLQLLTFAYDVRDYQFVSVPGWAKSDRFDVSFTPDTPEAAPDAAMGREKMEGLFNRQRLRTRAVLRDRFGLVVVLESREMPVYGLTLAKGGHKLKKTETESDGPRMQNNGTQLTGLSVYLSMLTNSLASIIGRPVVNETGLDGPFDFKMAWTAENDPAGGASIFTAIQEQLGLKLESRKGPVAVFVIEKMQKPSEN